MAFTSMIDFKVFVFSLCIGLFLAYITSPELDTIVVYPNPDNEDRLQYKDKSGMCHRFRSQEIEFPKNKASIRKYPIQLKKNAT